MNKLSCCLILLICTIYNVNCYELKNICKSDHFLFKNRNDEKTLVNSYAILSLNKKLPKISDFRIVELEAPYYLVEKDKNELNKVKSDYELLVSEVLNHQFINSIREMNEDLIQDKYERWEEANKKLKKIFDYQKEGYPPNEVDELLKKYENKLNVLLYLIQNLLKINNDNLDSNILKSSELRNLLDNLNSQLTKEQTAVFPYENLFKYYYFQQVLKFKSFKLGNNHIESIINFDVFVPIYNEKHTNENCIKVDDSLPKFFNSHK